MTAYEYADIAASNYSISFTILSLMVALVSAYFVAAYFMGKSINGFQVFLLNTVYLLWMSGLAWVATRFLIRATQAATISLSLDESQTGTVFASAYLFPALMAVTTLLISYGFMWSLRHGEEK
ncbi:hypothetical protein EY643_05375 [Halioglobus maricola]|uniref:Uncharacterized protein n=1 Tax=Halioglobus maricola TaxID=2601894 RepID=A0A5P9NIS5_9GAMM|nr:hypothetical protein [Halioglobus maricola]QFU75124.1 hypothetical protein EY643_05375 [Halioglobus maricola]